MTGTKKVLSSSKSSALEKLYRLWQKNFPSSVSPPALMTFSCSNLLSRKNQWMALTGMFGTSCWVSVVSPGTVSVTGCWVTMSVTKVCGTFCRYNLSSLVTVISSVIMLNSVRDNTCESASQKYCCGKNSNSKIIFCL